MSSYPPLLIILIKRHEYKPGVGSHRPIPFPPPKWLKMALFRN